jgi:hypothetical protein
LNLAGADKVLRKRLLQSLVEAADNLQAGGIG